MDDKKIRLLMECVRKSENQQKQKYTLWLAKVHQVPVEKMENAAQKKKEKEQEQLIQKENLSL